MKALTDSSWGAGLLALVEILLVAGFVWLGNKTELLRDSDPKEPDFQKRPYSMAKSQLAFWIVLPGSVVHPGGHDGIGEAMKSGYSSA